MKKFQTPRWLLGALCAGLLAQVAQSQASQAYGSIDNFDVVNDNPDPCHGFEIEIEDAHSTDITYTFDWNHYGVPTIIEDNSNPLHPRVRVRYESKKNPDGSWASYTAVPTVTIAPTDGHQFTDPSVNFGGEHFGVGYYGVPTSVRYHWLVDDGSGNLIHGTAVNIATPTFTYNPPAAVPAQVQAAIVPPPPPAPPLLEFGEPAWVKEIRTQTHNSHKVELRDLITDDPVDNEDENWANGEPDEVEVEWQLLQEDYNSAGGGPNGELVGAPEDLPGGDEVITRRYEFFKYIGPIDTETGEAMADSVGPDGIHGVGTKTINGVEVDLSTVEIVGDYIGAQMAGFDAASQLGLIDHLQDGEVDVPYVGRTMVVGGTPPITTVRTGALPDGMSFDEVTGILDGTPTVEGAFTFALHSADAAAADVTTTYTLTILPTGGVAAPRTALTTRVFPAGSGVVAGDGEYAIGASVDALAAPAPRFVFLKWTDGGTEVSNSPDYSYTSVVNRELIATFVPAGGPDIFAPTSLASVVDFTQAAANIGGSYTASDGTGTGVTSVTLYVKPPDGVWTSAGPITGGIFTFAPADGDGDYHFQTVATDAAGNTETAPTWNDPGDVTVFWNDASDSSFTYPTIADGTYDFPLTGALDLQITFSGGSYGGPISVTRISGDITEAGLGADKLIDESISITGTFTGTAYLTWNVDPASDDTLTAPFDTVFKINGGAVSDQFVVTPGTSPIVIGPLTSFSNFYAGNANAAVGDWASIDE